MTIPAAGRNPGRESAEIGEHLAAALAEAEAGSSEAFYLDVLSDLHRLCEQTARGTAVFGDSFTADARLSVRDVLDRMAPLRNGPSDSNPSTSGGTVEA